MSAPGVHRHGTLPCFYSLWFPAILPFLSFICLFLPHKKNRKEKFVSSPISASRETQRVGDIGNGKVASGGLETPHTPCRSLLGAPKNLFESSDEI